MQLVGSKMGKADMARNAVVHTQVHLGQPNDMDGFGLEVEIKVDGADQELIDAGHAVSESSPTISNTANADFSQACPYSRALKNGAVVKVSKA